MQLFYLNRMVHTKQMFTAMGRGKPENARTCRIDNIYDSCVKSLCSYTFGSKIKCMLSLLSLLLAVDVQETHTLT